MTLGGVSWFAAVSRRRTWGTPDSLWVVARIVVMPFAARVHNAFRWNGTKGAGVTDQGSSERKSGSSGSQGSRGGSGGSGGSRRSNYSKSSSGRSGGYRGGQSQRDDRGGRGGGRDDRGRYGRDDQRGGGQDRDSRGRNDRGRDDRGGRDRREESGPPIPDDVTGNEIELFIWDELRALPDTKAQRVAQHLEMVARLWEVNPQRAREHAQAARDMVPRLAILRQTLGMAAYQLGDFGAARNELRAAQRISASDEFLPVLADCERGLGHPERALEVTSAAPRRLRKDVAAELLIVEAGARRDLGQPDAAVLALQTPLLKERTSDPWAVRYRYAYADALHEAGRVDEARKWFAAAAEIDGEGMTDAAERLQDLAP